MIGVLIVAVVGELLRRVRLGELRFDPEKAARGQTRTTDYPNATVKTTDNRNYELRITADN